MWSLTRTSRLCQCNVRLLTSAPLRRAASTTATKDLKQRSTPVATQLWDTGLWQPNPGRRRAKAKTTEAADGGEEKKPRTRRSKAKAPAKPPAKGDRTRVNIASEKLCDDITKYIGPTLERHVGCDILDINPGAGVWSQKLHDVLKPRSHILMEPDAELYKPFLEPLLSRPGTRLVPQSGILWKELREAMKYLEHQVEQVKDLSTEPKRNDTLIVTANLCSYPKRRYRNFDSLAVLVLFQLLSSVRSSSLFQKYGLIRMMLWINDDDKRFFVPRCAQNRKKSALEAEFACEWLAEVAGKDPATLEVDPDQLKKLYMRDYSLDIESSRATLARMKEFGIDMPPEHRTMELTTAASKATKARKKGSGDIAAYIRRPWVAELEALEKAYEAGEIEKGSVEFKRRSKLRNQLVTQEKDAQMHALLLRDLGEISQLHLATTPNEKKIAKKDSAYNDKVQALNKMGAIEYRLARDNAHLFRQDPPAMLWDRRPWEPLKVEAEEFFPNVDCALLDIQPKAMNQLLRNAGTESNRAADILDLIQRSLLMTSLEPISSALEKLWPGAREGVLEHCPSLRDPVAGGLPGSGHAELCPRIMNEKQWMEILDAFMKWPFRPSYAEMVGRLGDDIEVPDAGGPVDTGI